MSRCPAGWRAASRLSSIDETCGVINLVEDDDLVKEAFSAVYPGRECSFVADVQYSGRFKGYNANARKVGSRLEFGLSRKWRSVDREIRLGLLQELLIRLMARFPEFSRPSRPLNLDLYHHFLRSVHVAVEKTESDPILAGAFEALNDQFFFSVLEQPNLVWGRESYRKLGSYDFGTDTITISRALDPQSTGDASLLSYVLYHEMLHKKHKFSSSGRRTCSHSVAFRTDEAMFPDAKDCERRLGSLRPSRRLRHARSSSPSSDAHPFHRLVRMLMG